jgi:hypothetical protein
MAILKHLLAGFIGGEIDPFMFGRVDTEQYAYGLEKCENFVAVNEGPLVKRPGFEYIRDAAPTASWLGAFRRSIDQEYVIEWSEEAARFYTNGLRIESDPVTPYEITTPYAAADAPYLSTAQSYDRLYIDHGSYPPAALARLTATTFDYDPLAFRNGPFLDQNIDKTVTVIAGATTGAGVALTASSGIFAAGMVGSPIEIEALDFSDLKAWEPGMKDVVIGDIVRNEGKAYTAVTGGTTGGIPPTHTSGSEWDGQLKKDLLNDKGPYGVQWAYRHGRRGIATIASYASPTSVTVDIVQRLPDSVTSVATYRWSLGAFSAAKGWPSIVTIGAGRMVHFKEMDIFASVVGDFGGGSPNFARYTDVGALAADLAFRRTIASDSPPLWAVPTGRRFLIGTASSELAIGAINSALALSGDNVSADPQTDYGSERVAPIKAGKNVLFVERGGRRVRSADYDFGRDGFDAMDLTSAARHITASGVVQLAYQRLPRSMALGVRADGQLIVHCNTRADIKGFARTVCGGAARIVSAVSVIGADGKTDELWVLVQRQRADGLKREMWRQTAWREPGDDRVEAFFVDGGVRTDAAASQTHFTGLTHLAGQDVAVLANGGVVPGMKVGADGSLDLPATSVPAFDYVMIVGLAYTAEAVTLRPEPRQRGETVQGAKQKIVKALLRLLDTFGIRIGDADPRQPLDEVLDRSADDLMDEGVPFFSGDQMTDVGGEWDRRGAVRFVSSDPLPCIVNAAVLHLEVEQ